MIAKYDVNYRILRSDGSECSAVVYTKAKFKSVKVKLKSTDCLSNNK